MKLKTPLYLVFALGLCGYLTLASRNGWVLWQTLTPRVFRPGLGSVQHK
jgi:hypothetical protein